MNKKKTHVKVTGVEVGEKGKQRPSPRLSQAEKSKHLWSS
jgi:hypothetical protein